MLIYLSSGTVKAGVVSRLYGITPKNIGVACGNTVTDQSEL
jgi:hypothetical protein